MLKPSLFDVTIIGGGPVGLYAAFYSGLRSMKTKIIDAEPDVGGKIRYFYPEKLIHDIGGIPEILGADLVANFTKQAETFNPTFVLNTRATSVVKQNDGTFYIKTDDGTVHLTKTIIIAVGSGTYKMNPLEARFAENFPAQIHYHLRDLEKLRDKKVVISGGGDAALDAALMLLPIAKSVELIYRGDDFKGYEERAKAVHSSGITTHLHHEITSLHGDENLKEIELTCKHSGENKKVMCDAVFVNHGVEVDIGTMRDWGFATEEWGITVDKEMQTTVPGIYACGDVACYPRKIRIIAAGLHEGPIAVNSAKKYLDPNAAPEAMVSTHHEHFMH
ncbi:NAD(P)/FAD-dependent oxidoreductase [Listeria sp. ILCC804]|uniref:NAD(P)/FAD-dependent oxidoreductase n=1 Tax=Listeria TaxID=1637 RepID=UPI003514A335